MFWTRIPRIFKVNGAIVLDANSTNFQSQLRELKELSEFGKSKSLLFVTSIALYEQLMRTTKAARITVFNRIVFDIGTSKTGTGDHYFAEKTD